MDQRVRRLAESYGEAAAAYRELWAPVLLPLTCCLLDRLPLAGASVVLDVGTGVGAALGEIRARAPSALVIGIDRSIGMLRMAVDTDPRVVMDAMSLAIRSQAVDVAVLAFMLFHVPDPRAALDEVHAALRPGGSVGAITWGQDADVPAWNIWAEELDATGAPEPDRSEREISNHSFMDTPEKLSYLLSSAGFVHVDVRSEQLGYAPDVSAFVELQTRCRARERLSMLPRGQRHACVERVRARLLTLPPEDFVDRSEVLLATGQVDT